MKRAAVAYAIAAVFAALAVGFMIAAGYMAAAAWIGPIAAALAFAGGFIVIAGVVIIVHRSSEASRLKELERQRTTEMATIGTAAALAVLPSVLRGKAGLATILAPAVAVGAFAAYRLFKRPGGRRRRD